MLNEYSAVAVTHAWSVTFEIVIDGVELRAARRSASAGRWASIVVAGWPATMRTDSVT